MTENKATICVDLQIACQEQDIPSKSQFTSWVEAVLTPYNRSFELTIRLVNNTESQQLNYQYRAKDNATNVLSFPFEAPESVELDLLGDLVICADIVKKEAQEQNKDSDHHWAHLVIHGCLHLLGFDHVNDTDAEEMEALEIKLLQGLNIADPYHIIE